VGQAAERIRAAAWRLLQAQIENRCGMEVIQVAPVGEVLIYADPPYILTTRTGGLYKDELHIQEHEDPAAAALRSPRPGALSSLHHDLYEERLPGLGEKNVSDELAPAAGWYEEITLVSIRSSIVMLY